MSKQVETKNNKKLGSAAGAGLFKITAGIFKGAETNNSVLTYSEWNKILKSFFVWKVS